MLKSVVESITQTLINDGINAVAAFPVADFDKQKTVICVSIRSVKITSCGCGNYIGLCLENGVIKEMFGSHGCLKIGLDIYSPMPDCENLKENVCNSLGSMSSLKVKNFEASEVSFDGKSEMYYCKCTAEAEASLVRSLSEPAGVFKLEED